MSAFEELKSKLTSPQILALFGRYRAIAAVTNAYRQQFGAVLIQDQMKRSTKLIGYFSLTLNRAEKNYDTTERECLAVTWACLLLWPYLKLQGFTIVPDLESLKRLLTYKDSSVRLSQGHLRLL